MQSYIEVFINTFASSADIESLEHVNSRRLRYLLECKKNIPIQIIDINTEMQAFFGDFKEFKTHSLIREELISHFKLVRNRGANN